MPANIFEMIGELSGNAKKEDTLSFIMKYGKKRIFKLNDVIVTEGSSSNTVYIILSGTAEVFRRDTLNDIVTIATLKDGDIFGEMGIFLDKKRTASIKAISDLVAAEFTNADFVKALLEIPDLMYRLFRSLAQNITYMNDKINRMNEFVLLKTIAHKFLLTANPKLSLNDEYTISTRELAEELKISHDQVYSCLQYMKKNQIIDNLRVIGGSLFLFKINPDKLNSILDSCHFEHE